MTMDTTEAPATPAQRAETVRDLKSTISGLNAMDQQEIVFKDTSPRQPRATVYSMKTGRAVSIPAYLLDQTLAKRDEKGFMFTAYREKAPAYVAGTIKCFLHPESAERAVMDAIGLQFVTCRAGALRSEYAKRMHAEHRHSSEWALFQEHENKQREQEYRERQEASTNATLELARAAAANAPAKKGGT